MATISIIDTDRKIFTTSCFRYLLPYLAKDRFKVMVLLNEPGWGVSKLSTSGYKRVVREEESSNSNVGVVAELVTLCPCKIFRVARLHLFKNGLPE